jgi:hypothetical protein
LVIANVEVNVGKLINLPNVLLEGDDLEGSGGLAKSIAEWARPLVISTWTAIKRSTFSASSEARRRRLDGLQHKIDEVWLNFCDC